MAYYWHYESPLGGIIMEAAGESLTGLWFEQQCSDLTELADNKQELPVFEQTCRWLDIYFAGQEPDFTPELKPAGSDFRQLVWRLLLAIPYGQTCSYGQIAGQAAQLLGRKRMSAQAVGGAVGHNPISIIIPCHRVIGADGGLVGYGGGLALKTRLLALEQGDKNFENHIDG